MIPLGAQEARFWGPVGAHIVPRRKKITSGWAGAPLFPTCAPRLPSETLLASEWHPDVGKVTSGWALGASGVPFGRTLHKLWSHFGVAGRACGPNLASKLIMGNSPTPFPRFGGVVPAALFLYGWGLPLLYHTPMHVFEANTCLRSCPNLLTVKAWRTPSSSSAVTSSSTARGTFTAAWRASIPHIPGSWRASIPHIPSSWRASIPHIPGSWRASIPNIPSSWRASIPQSYTR